MPEGRNKILLVEDEVLISMSEQANLEGFGYRVVAVKSGEEAVEAVTMAADFDLVLMDIDLGKGIDGTEAAERIVRMRDIPIVFLSSHMEPSIVARTEKITSYGYVVKNSGIVVLDASIKMAFKLHFANARTRELNDRLEATFEALPDVMFEVGPDGRYYDYHSSAAGLPQKRADEVIGRTIGEVMPSDVAKIGMDAIGEADEKGYSRGRQFSLESPEGVRWYEISVSKKTGAGRDPRFIFISRDITERKDAALALEESEHRLSDVILSAADWVWEVNQDGVYTYSSRKGYELLGDGILGKTPFDFMPPGEAARVGAIFTEIKENRAPIKDLENWNIGADGELICLLTNGVPIFDMYGRLQGYRGVDKDITKQKKDREELERQRELLSTIIESSSEAIFAKDAGGSYLVINEAGARMMGYESREVIGRTDIELFPAGEGLSIRESDLLVMRSGFPSKHESRLRGKERVIDLSVAESPWIDSSGGIVGVIGVASEITERKNLEGQLREGDRKNRAIIDQLRDGVVVADENGKAVLWNKSMERITGITAETALGREAWALQWELLPEGSRTPERLELAKRYAADAIADRLDLGAAWETTIAKASGERVHVEASYFTVKSGRDQMLGAILRDIGERKLAEDRIREYADRLESTMKAARIIWWELDVASDRLKFDDAIAEIFGYPPDRIGSYADFSALVHPEDLRLVERGKDLLSKGEGQSCELEFRIMNLSGKYCWYYITGSPSSRDGDRGSPRIAGVLMDIDFRKRREEEIGALLREKELILKEVHHRVKNNMNTMKSLIHLQSIGMESAEGISALRDAEGRLESMILLFDVLYQSKSYAEVSAKAYLMDLARQIIRNFPSQAHISIQDDFDDFELDTKKLQPLAIIVNEILTNIMKHAFVGRTEGIILLSGKILENPSRSASSTMGSDSRNPRWPEARKASV